MKETRSRRRTAQASGPRSLARPDADVIYTMRVTLRDLAPPIWREIRIEASDRLSRLHDAIQAAFGWTDSHLHEFRIEERMYGMRDDESPKDIVEDRKVKIADVLAEGETCVYLYDFGDDWHHDIVVESVTARDTDVAYPICTGGARACPPDDAGGPDGYQRLLEAILDPTHEDHAEMRQWIGGYWDPEGFDANAVNRLLRERLAKGRA